MRNLEQDAGAVAGVLLESRTAAVLQVDQNGQRVVQDLVMALAVDIGKRADATCIVVEFRGDKGPAAERNLPASRCSPWC